MKSVIVHALLAVFGLGFAYQTWTRKPEEETAPGSVEVATCDLDGLQKLALETPTLEVQIEPVREKNETKYFITTRHRSPDEVKAAGSGDKAKVAGDQAANAAKDAGVAEAAKPATDTAADKAADANEPKPVPEAQRPKRFLANTAFKDYLKRVTPLRAQRSLGKLESKLDADFGFDKVGTRLQLECGGRTLKLEAGARAYGASQRYLRDDKTQTTFLFDEALVSDLESAQFKFMQTELHTFAQDDVEEATISAHNATRRLLHRDRKLRDQAQWVDDKAPAKRNELYNNWFARVGRLRARAYLSSSAEPGSDLKTAAVESAPVLHIEYKLADKPAGKLELVRVDENGVGHYYARTETTRGWVALYDSAAKEVEQDVGMVVGVEQPTSKPAATAPAGQNTPSVHGLPAGHPQLPGTH